VGFFPLSCVVVAIALYRDLGRVTNWFRNLRQTSRKRAQKSAEGNDAPENDFHDHEHGRRASGSASGDEDDDRSMYSDTGSPEYQSSGDYSMDMDEPEDHPHGATHSDVASDDEYQEEALTPESTPPPSRHAPEGDKKSNVIITSLDPALYEEAQKATKNFKSGVQAEDALLLLSFHKHTIVH
jgi:hypothetical protein